MGPGCPRAWDHIKYILTYSTELTSSCPNGIIACPWQWLLNQVQIPYLRVNVSTTVGTVTSSYTFNQFHRQLDPAISYLTIPAVLYCAYNYYQRRDDLSLLVVGVDCGHIPAILPSRDYWTAGYVPLLHPASGSGYLRRHRIHGGGYSPSKVRGLILPRRGSLRLLCNVSVQPASRLSVLKQPYSETTCNRNRQIRTTRLQLKEFRDQAVRQSTLFE